MKRIKLLIVDDEKLFAEFLSDFFGSLNEFKVIAVLHDGSQVLDYVKAKKPDIVLLDLNMPKLNGLETIKQLRNASVNIKIIVLSSIIDTVVLKKLSNTGVEGVITKNTHKDEIEKLDFYYAKNQNIWMDLEIISKSLNKMLNKKN